MSTASWNPEVYRRLSLSECHWKLCRRFMTRYQHRFSEEKAVALAQIFANTQLLMEGDAERTMELVLDLVKPGDQPSEDATGVKVEVKRERESVENDAGIKMEVEQREKIPTEVIAVKEEPEGETNPQKSAIKQECEESKRTLESTVKTETIVLSDDEEFSKCTKQKPSKQKAHVPFITEFDAGILAGLTRFKPPETIRNFGDIYRSLVIFNKFHQSCGYFNRLGLGSLKITCKKTDAVYRCSIDIKTDLKEFHLAEDYAVSKRKAKERVEELFTKKMKVHCYQIVDKKPTLLPENQIARLVDPSTNIRYYKTMIKKLKKEAIRSYMTFSKDFSEPERDMLKRIAHKLDLKAFETPVQKQLKIRNQTIPALAILERVLVQKDPEVCELYEVIPPRKGGQVICKV